MRILNPIKSPEITFIDSSPSNLIQNFNNEILADYFVSETLTKARRAAQAHRNSRAAAMNIIKPGIKLSEICEIIENSTRIQLKGEKNDGLGFPTGVSLNSCAAHFTVLDEQSDHVLTENDVLKVDFGTHVDGWIMDSAFTVCFNEQYDPLLLASKEATEAGIKMLAPDTRVCAIGAKIAEIINQAELVIDGKTIPIKPMKNLNGHSIGRYTIHDGLTIPNVNNHDNSKVTPDTLYAVETFATTGNAYVVESGDCSHYILNKNGKPMKNPKNKAILDVIQKKIGKLPFCPRFVDHLIPSLAPTTIPIKTMALLKNFDKYPPLIDIKGSHVAQFEHTIWVSDSGKEVLTRGDDY